jgi:hypothetical protein
MNIRTLNILEVGDRIVHNWGQLRNDACLSQ